MSAGLTSGTLTVPASGSQPALLRTALTATSVLVFNPTGNSSVYIGDSTSTSSTGIPIAAGQSLTIDLGDAGAVYVSGTQNDIVRYLVVGR